MEIQPCPNPLGGPTIPPPYRMGEGIAVPSVLYKGELLFPLPIFVWRDKRIFHILISQVVSLPNTPRGYGHGGNIEYGLTTELKSALEGIRVGHGFDRVVWRWNEKDLFKFTYKVLRDGGLRDDCALKIWSLHPPPKVQIFVWLAFRKRLLMVDNLVKRGGPKTYGVSFAVLSMKLWITYC